METGVNIILPPAAPGQHGHQSHPAGDGDPPEEAVPFFGGIWAMLQGWGHPGGLGTRLGFTGEKLFLTQSKN